MTSLFPDDVRATKTRARTKKPRTRRQYRRAAWEDYCEATLWAMDLVDEAAQPIAAETTDAETEVPLWLLRDWQADLAPVLKAIRTKRADVYRARHARKLGIHHPADHRRPCDLAKAITDLAKAFREEMLAEDGVRFAAKGVHRVRKKDGLAPSWRAQPWSPSLGRHVHVGYFSSEAAAWDAIRQWYDETENVDGIVEVPKGSAMAELMALLPDALRSQAVTAEDSHRRRWGELTGGPDDD